MTRLTFIGDIACDRPLLHAAKHGRKYDYSRVFQTEDVFSGSDYVIGNMESCFGGAHYGKKPYHYSVPDSFCEAVRGAGVSIVGTANNHCLDEGMYGLKRTQSVLEKNGILYTGTYDADYDGKRYLIVEKNGIRFGFYSLTYSVNSNYESNQPADIHKVVNLLGFKPRTYSRNPFVRYWETTVKPNQEKKRKKKQFGSTIAQYADKLTDKSINQDWLNEIDEQIREARKESDILAILLHIGGQFNTEPGTFSEFMVGQLCDLGADIIAGHHPHTLQKITKRGDTLVAYSLGGFCLSPSGEYLIRESLPQYSAAWHIDIGDDKKIADSSVTILKVVEEEDHYAHVVEAEKESENIQLIRNRLNGEKPDSRPKKTENGAS